MAVNSSLKDYYIKIQKLYSEAVNILTALNQSLSTSASEVSVTLADGTGTVRIPSFLYLENKLETLSGNFEALFNIPKSGEAWFQRNLSSDMYKLNLVKANTAPASVSINQNQIYGGAVENNIIKDLVNPKLYIRLNISDLPDNIDKAYMQKIIIYDKSLYDTLSSAGYTSYEEVKAVLYNMTPGTDYSEYGSILDLPLKRDRYISEFHITDIPNTEYGNPYYAADDTAHNHLLYSVQLDTITYTDKDDTSLTYTIKTGDILTLRDSYVLYRVKEVTQDTDSELQPLYTVILEEYLGHQALQPYSENTAMTLEIYNTDYSEFKYIDIPLEENPYICVFIGSVYDNVRSTLSAPLFLNLNEIYMHDASGTLLYDGNSSTPVTCMQYYQKYCKNIGDLIDAVSQTAYPQLDDYSNADLEEMTSGQPVKNAVSGTISADGILTVKRINRHLIDDVTSDKIIALHAQKASIKDQLSTLQDNIDQVYNQMTVTDFNQNVSVTLSSLTSKLDGYYNERITLQKQLSAIINNISALAGDAKGTDEAKYRIRGNVTVDQLTDYLHTEFGDSCDIIGMDLEYKYKSANNDTTNITAVNSSVFTDWVKLPSVPRERELEFDSVTGKYNIKFTDYSSNINIIKWTQVDIPITQGEEVVIRVRYKYSTGDPFINLYTPWSDEITVAFPTEYEEDYELGDIISDNADDEKSAMLTQKLSDEGYTEHVSDKIIDASQTFYHQPEHIYSGFNTSENNMLSLKDKLTEMVNDIDAYKSAIDSELNSEYKVYLEWDNNSVLLNDNTENNIIINEQNSGVTNTFTRKNMNIVIKNTGDINIKLYSIFPGTVTMPLLLTENRKYKEYISEYERVPFIIAGSDVPSQQITYQTLGQWLYFRSDNPYSKKDYYFSSDEQDGLDLSAIMSGEKPAPDGYKPENYLKKDYTLPQLAYRYRTIDGISIYKEVTFSGSTASIVTSDYDYSNTDPDLFIYDTDKEPNRFLMLYEHVYGNNGKDTYLSENTNISSFISEYISGKGGDDPGIETSADLVGACLAPVLSARSQILCDTEARNQYRRLDIGKSLSIPVVFEYYLPVSDDLTSVTKTLCFEIRPSVFKDPVQYILNITAKKDMGSVNSDIINSVSPLIDMAVTGV